MAAVALDRLLRVLRAAESVPEGSADYVLDHLLIQRDSTAPPPTRPRRVDERLSNV
jgi:LacI family transcriptional regulator